MRLLIILIISYSTCFAQTDTLSYLGTLIAKNNQIITFSIHFVESNGIINGYSITNIGLQDETKSEISGLYFKNTKTFQIQETQILSTKSESPLNTFCYINMNIKLKGILQNKRLEGFFTANFLDSTQCAEGKVILIEKNKIEKKIKKVKKKIEKKININDNILETKILKNNDDFSINWNSEKVILFIWDSNKEDGDKIQLKINNKIILKNYETKNKRKKIIYPLKKGENIIEITALNLGASSPNTSRVELVDNKIKYPLMTQLTIGKNAIIKLIKEQ